MATHSHPRVAVLLATYNGSQFVGRQIRSLKDNATQFTLHWIDDHSSDNTREVVRSCAQLESVNLVEWHEPQHLGLPSTFFRLIERVEADIYFFCDQDDIWQPGKLDAARVSLIPDISRPVLCFADSLMFKGDEPGSSTRLISLHRTRNAHKPMREPLMFGMFTRAMALGHTQAFTRPLRDIFLRHKAIAHAYAYMHDWWMYDIAIASGVARMLKNVPTALWRQHQDSFHTNIVARQSNAIAKWWKITQRGRRIRAKHARGFIYAAPTLPPGENVDRLYELAQLIERTDRRQTPAAVARLAARGAIPPYVWLYSVASVCCDATLQDPPLHSTPASSR